MTKADPRIHKTKLAIRNALFSLMKKKNISDITISEVSALAEINRKSFYNHYNNLQDVLYEYQEEYLSAIFSTVQFSSKSDSQDYSACIEILYAAIRELQKDEILIQFINECNECSHFFSSIGEHIKKIAPKTPHQMYFNLYVDFISGGISSIFKTIYQNKASFQPEELYSFLEKCIHNTDAIQFIFS